MGKSTLFNRLVGRREAIVHPTPGVTRDRREGEGQIGDLRFHVIDTAGLDEAGDELRARMQAQTERALADADVALLLVDARAGITPTDEHFVRWVRRSRTPVLLVANKCEGRGGEAGLLEAYGLGLGEPVPISAEHGEGLGHLYDMLRPFAGPGEETTAGPPEKAAVEIRLAVIGRPNVGKSTLVNRLLGEERMLTGPEPGVTRDAIQVAWDYEGQRLRLVDTAGLRRRARISDRLEKLSVSDALRAVRLAEVVILVVDARQMFERQDLVIADMVVNEGRALVIAVNKWDLIEDRGVTRRRMRDALERALPQVRGVPTVTLSALTGANMVSLMPAVLHAYEVWNRRVPTAPLNRWLAEVSAHHPPPAPQGRRIRLRYITQVKTRPPTFALFASRPEALTESYVRYLVNALRESFDLPGVPLRLMLRKGRNPYVRA